MEKIYGFVIIKKRARASGGHSFSTSHCESVRLQR